MSSLTAPFRPFVRPRARLATALVGIVIALAFALVLGFAPPAHAEGSKDLVAHGGYRPYTERYNASTAGESRLTEIYAYVKEGETVSFGTSIKDALARFTNEKMGTNLSAEQLAALNRCDVVVCDPDWVAQQKADPGSESANPHAYPYFQGQRDERVTAYDVSPTATADGGDAGYIGSVGREAAGPTPAGGDGYTPLSFTARKSGLYLFKFYSQALSSSNPRPYLADDDRAFAESAQAGGTVAAWDVTVSNAGGPQIGRVFTDKLFLNMGKNFDASGILMSHMFAVTDDNYHYEIDFNGMDPFGFVFFANNRGLLDGSLDDLDATRSLYHSVRSQNNALSDLAEHGVILNNAPTTSLDRTHKLFFNNPTDPDVLAALGIATATGDATISKFAFAGNPSPSPAAPALGADEGYVGKGGRFSFDVGDDVAATSFEITLDFTTDEEKAQGLSNIVLLSNTLVKGATNTIEWNGLDSNGMPVPAGEYDLNNVSIKLKGGEVHFPLLDVENNYDGVKIHRLGDGGTVEDSIVYYNDSAANAGDTTAPWNMTNWVVADQRDTSVAGADSSSGALAYKNRAGDQTALDIWTYHDSPVALVNFKFKLIDVPTRLTVHKTWDHGANHGAQPVDATVELLADGQPTGRDDGTQTLVAAPGSTDGGSYTWENLDPTKQYTVRESGVPESYQPSMAVVGDNEEGWSIELVNAYIGDVEHIKVQKDWNGTPPPSELSVDVVGFDESGVERYRTALALDAAHDWSASIENLTADQRKLWFELQEQLPEGYRALSDTNEVVAGTDGTSTLVFSLVNEKTLDLTLVKAWDDDDNGRGVRPQSVQLQLLKDGQPFGDAVTVTEADGWAHTWKDLKDDGGSYEAFAAYEVNGATNYASTSGSPDSAVTFVDGGDGSGGTALITNTIISTTQFSVSKAWVNDSSEPLPDSIDVQLYQNGLPYGDPVTITEADGWEHTWFNLPERNMTYSANETAVPPDYSAETTNTGNVASITNTYTGGVAQIVVQKDWSGDKPPASLDVRVVGTNALGETKYDSGAVTLDEAHDWSATLPVAVGQRNLDFAVSEVVPDGYEQLGSKSALSDDGTVLTFSLENRKTPELINLSVHKAWDDDNDSQGIRPSSVRFQLLKDGLPFGDPTTASADTGWDCAWTGLADDGSTYTVHELDGVEGYASDAPSADRPAGFVDGRAVVTNAVMPTTSLTVDKRWVNNTSDPLPASVDVQLYQNGLPFGDPVTLTQAGSWTHTWTNLPAQGKTYTAKETTTLPDYTSTSATEGDTVVITNTNTSDIEHLAVQKTWVGGAPPERLDVRVTGTDAQGRQRYDSGTIALAAADAWQAALPDPPADESLSYEATETTPDGYKLTSTACSLSADGKTLTFELTNQKVTNLKVTKLWDGGVGSRTQNVRLQLLKDSLPLGGAVIVNADNDWSHTWNDLVDDGSIYTVYEVSDVPGFKSDAPSPDAAQSFEGGEASITNVPSPTTSFTVVKKWVDYSGEALPASIETQLYQNGLPYGEPVLLTADDNWTRTWNDLPAQGMAYTAKETAVPDGFEADSVVDGTACTITNTRTGGIERITVQKAWTGGDPPVSLDVNVSGIDAQGVQRYNSGTVTLSPETGWQATLDIPVGKGTLAFDVTETAPDG